jgi:hypothetical protein
MASAVRATEEGGGDVVGGVAGHLHGRHRLAGQPGQTLEGQLGAEGRVVAVAAASQKDPVQGENLLGRQHSPDHMICGFKQSGQISGLGLNFGQHIFVAQVFGH